MLNRRNSLPRAACDLTLQLKLEAGWIVTSDHMLLHANLARQRRRETELNPANLGKLPTWIERRLEIAVIVGGRIVTVDVGIAGLDDDLREDWSTILLPEFEVAVTVVDGVVNGVGEVSQHDLKTAHASGLFDSQTTLWRIT